MSYALYGIFDVSLGANYGENQCRARERLLGAIRKRENLAIKQAERFKKIADWLSAPDPYTNHESARKHHEPETGAWLLYSGRYKAWKLGAIKHLWIYGKAGCGKTILCSTTIEDVRAHCKATTNVKQAVFYFSFSDNAKQTFEGLVRSLIVQLGCKEPGLSLLQQAYERPDHKLLRLHKLHRILLACIASYDKVFLHLDALDECPSSNEGRLHALSRIEDFLQSAPNVHLLATSRDVPHARHAMEKINAQSISIADRTVDSDVQRYVSTQLSRDWKLSQLDSTMKKLVEKTFAEKADGMFRWAYCQLENLKRSQSTKPKAIKAALLALPATLDETYERILTGIEQDSREEALTLLRWITYAQSPRTLGELAEASIVYPTDDPAAGGVVDVENRGGWVDTLAILGGLVFVYDTEDDNVDGESHELKFQGGKRYGLDLASHHKVEKDARVRLSHFSVQEYLESARILEGSAKGFHLNPTCEHIFLAQSCLVYLKHYFDSPKRVSGADDMLAFPLLRYAAESWFYHSRLQQCSSNTRELRLLASDDDKNAWLLVYVPDISWCVPFESPGYVGTGLYYASFIGLKGVVAELLARGSNINAYGGYYGNALQAATENNDKNMVKLLLENGADTNFRRRSWGNPLHTASRNNNKDIVGLLLSWGVDANVRGGPYGNALQAAIENDCADAAQLLLDAGANVNAVGGFGTPSNALYAASDKGNLEMVRILLQHGANADGEGGVLGHPLAAASWRGSTEVAKLLFTKTIDIDKQGGLYSTALQAASSQGHKDMVKFLLGKKANTNVQGGFFGCALQAASAGGHTEIVKMLLDHGSYIDAQGGEYGSALQAASVDNHIDIVGFLLKQGADVHVKGGKYGNALQAALLQGHAKIVDLLLEHGAAVNPQESPYSSAVEAT